MRPSRSIRVVQPFFLIALFALAIIVPQPALAIKNGQLVGQDEFVVDFPWAVFLIGANAGPCTGELISPTRVLTAAHCIGDGDDITHAIVGASLFFDGTLVEVEAATAHPQADAILGVYDVAVLTLADAVAFPILALASDADIRNAASTAQIAGWGETEFGIPSDILRRGDVLATNLEITHLNIEYIGSAADPAPGPGDSGGPLLIMNSNGERVLAGITSLATSGNLLAIFTNIAAVRDFIHDNTPDLPSNDSDGPTMSIPSLEPGLVSITSVEPVIVTATGDDSVSGNSDIKNVRLSVVGADGVTLLDTFVEPIDHAFDSPTEMVSALIPIDIFPSAGFYEVCMLATDASDNSGSPSCAVLIVYDPQNAFLTVGGFYNASPGAYLIEPAKSGFVEVEIDAKYDKSGEMPKGSLSFSFEEAGLEVVSYDFEYLLELENQAVLKGRGQDINGRMYEFTVWTRDSVEVPGHGAIRFQLIDMSAGGGVIYDDGKLRGLLGGNVKVGKVGN